MRRLALLGLVLVPDRAWACATCVASAYGDRTFNWAFLGLLLMPFVVGGAIATVLGARHFSAWRQAHPRILRGAAGATHLASHEESVL